jgi:uncharacterized protein (TIGR02996 family)
MPTDEQRALWSAIRANPDDDTPRLVYADWLQEHGDEARAEFIRVQIEQNGLFSPSTLCPDPNDRTLTKREAKLLRLYREGWLRTIFEQFETAAQYDWSYSRSRVKFARGFARNFWLSLPAARYLAASDSEIEPLQDVTIDSRFLPIEESAAILREVALWPNAHCVSEIKAYDATDEFIKAIVSGHINRLQRIDFRAGLVSDAGAILLADWPQATSLRVLDLGDNQITDAGITAIAESPFFDTRLELRLEGNRFSLVAWNRVRARFKLPR